MVVQANNVNPSRNCPVNSQQESGGQWLKASYRKSLFHVINVIVSITVYCLLGLTECCEKKMYVMAVFILLRHA